MDLLKDITRELRGDDESDRGDGSAGRASRADAADSSTTDSPDERPSDEHPSDDDSPDEGASNGRQPSDSPGGDAHLCSFCETEFDADRRACPECDAELVLRGER